MICPECGAAVSPGGSCRENFDALLALEWSVPGGPGELTHFYVVATYVLQHPDSMGYTAEALAALTEGVGAALEGRVTVEELRRQARAFAQGPQRVMRRDGEPTVVWRRGGWRMTVADVLTVEPEREAYAARVTAWACSVCETLNGAGV